MKINVTQHEIDCGNPSPVSCPVSLAVCSAFAGASAYTDPDVIQVIHPDGTSANYETPVRVAGFIEAFDEDRAAVRPFSFDLPEALP